MKTKSISLLFAFMLLLPVSSYSQLGGVVRRAINRQVNNEIDSALDKKVQDEQNKNRAKRAEEEKLQQQQKSEQVKESNDQVSATSENNSGENQNGAAFGGLFGNKVTLKYNDDYKFSSRIYMVSETYDKNEVTKMDFYMFYNKSVPVIGIETQTIATDENATPILAKMVMDGENKTFIMLTDVNDMKMGMISEIPDENTQVIGPDGKPVKNYKPPTFTKTGNTRVVAGYKCDEYTYKAEDKTSGKVWFTKEANLNIDKRGWNSSNMSYYYGSPEFKDGIILATEPYNEKGKLEMKSETKEINENYPHNITVAGYTLRQMNMTQKK
jgi:hypothetical protein